MNSNGHKLFTFLSNVTLDLGMRGQLMGKDIVAPINRTR